MVRRRARLRDWVPVIIGVTALVLAVAGVVGLVSAHTPTADRSEDVAVFRPPLVGRMNDVVSGELRREAGCTYLDADDGRRWIVLFPDLGNRWRSDGLLVEQRLFPVSHSIDLRGKIVKIPAAGYDTDIPAACRPTGLFFLVQV